MSKNEEASVEPRKIPFSNIRKYLIVLTLVLLSGGIGYRLGEKNIGNGLGQKSLEKISNTNKPENIDVDFGLFWDVWSRLFTYYIDRDKLSVSDLVNGAIRGMVQAAGDPYTSYFTQKENQDFKDDLKGEFDGIGAQLGLKDGRIVVIAPLKKTPAEKAGIKAGDFIIKVNEEETTNWTIQQAVSKIRGKRGTSVNLEIYSEGENNTKKISIIRDTISVPSVESWVKIPNEIDEIKGTTVSSVLKSTNGKVAYLSLSRFGDNLSSDWEKGVQEVLNARKNNPNFKGVIFDLRNNPGGYLDGAVYIASEFIKEGTVVSQKNSDGTIQNYPVNRTGRLTDIPVVVLINKGSASASEIVAGALKDYKRATIVGETSFGKGSVQTPQDLKGGASLHVTTGKWLLPNGDSISNVGIKPDFEVLSSLNEASGDGQLAKALEILEK